MSGRSWSVCCVPSNPYSIFSIKDGVMDKRVIFYANQYYGYDIAETVTMSIAFHKDAVEVTMNNMYRRVMMNIKYIKSDDHIEVVNDSTYVYCEDEDGHYMTPSINPHPEYGERWALSTFLSVFDLDNRISIFNLFIKYAKGLIYEYFKCDEEDKKEV